MFNKNSPKNIFNNAEAIDAINQGYAIPLRLKQS